MSKKTSTSSERGTRPTKPKRDSEEFGGGKKGLIICSACGATYYKKSWHHSADRFESKKGASVKLVLCPADQMIKNKQYEGKVVIKNLPKEIETEVINLIKNTAKMAFEKDPMHRLISIGKGGILPAREGELAVLTTENELAVSIAKKIKNSHANKAELKISYSKEPSDVAIAIVEF
jgi:hypothetical protein